MRLQTILRINPVVWISPLLVLLAVLATSTGNIVPQITDLYTLALTSAGGSSIFLVAPVCAACAAWEGGRLRRAGWFALPVARSPLTIALLAIGPALIIGVVAVCAAIVAMFAQQGAVPVLDLRIIAKTIIIIAAHVLFGFAIGLHLPSVVAAPAVLLIDYAWMVLPIAMDPLWLRHLNGTWLSCCDLSSDLAPQAFVGAVVVALGFATSALLLLQPVLVPVRRLLALLPIIVAFIVSVPLVQHLGPDPAIARTTTLTCTSDQPRVCVWPEHRERLPEVTRIVKDATRRWRDIGVSIPTEFSEQRNPALLPQGASSFGFSAESRSSDILNALAYSLLPATPTCAASGGQFLGASASSYVAAWLVNVAGMPHNEVEGRFGAEISQTIAAVRALPVDQQQAWLTQNVNALRGCDIPPQLEISS